MKLRVTSVGIATAAACVAISTASLSPALAVAPTPKPVKTISQVSHGKAVLRLGDLGPAVRETQKRLTQAGIDTRVTGTYSGQTESNVAHLQAKFLLSESGNLNAATWRVLHRLTRRGDAVPSICKHKRRAICADQTQKILRYYRRGKLALVVDARFGGPGNRTRDGNKRISHKVWDDFSTMYGTAMPYSMYFDGGQAFHYSKFFHVDGYYGASHGCVNNRDKKAAKWLWRQIHVGDFAKLYTS